MLAGAGAGLPTGGSSTHAIRCCGIAGARAGTGSCGGAAGSSGAVCGQDRVQGDWAPWACWRQCGQRSSSGDSHAPAQHAATPPDNGRAGHCACIGDHCAPAQQQAAGHDCSAGHCACFGDRSAPAHQHAAGHHCRCACSGEHGAGRDDDAALHDGGPADISAACSGKHSAGGYHSRTGDKLAACSGNHSAGDYHSRAG